MKINPDKIYIIKGMSPLFTNNSNIVTNRDQVIIGYKGVGEHPIPETLLEDIASRNIRILEPKSQEDFVNLLKLSVKYSEYVDFEEVNEAKFLNQ